ncbi:hypothetical protein AB0E77_12840 [Streptomyces sp. NPDC032940]|uniref:hypothetical protein n=1 Tax=Streptomyces sp. NPDC032940 TaxID=3155366 RepID=UPI0033CF9F73
MEVSRRLRVTPDTVRTWRRFLERVIVRTLEEKPNNATHRSARSMAAAAGMPPGAHFAGA